IGTGDAVRWVTRQRWPVLRLGADAEPLQKNRMSPDQRVCRHPRLLDIPIRRLTVLPQAAPTNRRLKRRASALATGECASKLGKRDERAATRRRTLRPRQRQADIRARASERIRPAETRSKRSRGTSLL